MYNVVALVVGLVFGLGLIVSGMYNPAKILAFLDYTGRWDPSLPFVMVGAIAIGLVAFIIARKRTITLTGAPLRLPEARKVDLRLVGGSVVFGIGWGLAGFCPGPALVALGTGHVKAFIFVVAMLAGMGLFELLEKRKASATAAAAHRAHGHSPAAHARHAKGAHRAHRERGR